MIASSLQEALQRYHEATDPAQHAQLRQRVVACIDDTVHNYLAAGVRAPLMLKKMVVGALRDEVDECGGMDLLQLRTCVVRRCAGLSAGLCRCTRFCVCTMYVLAPTSIAQDGFALTDRQVEEVVLLRQAFVQRWSQLHAERCALVNALQRASGAGLEAGSERGHARGVLDAHDVLRRLSTNLAKDHVAGMTCLGAPLSLVCTTLPHSAYADGKAVFDLLDAAAHGGRRAVCDARLPRRLCAVYSGGCAAWEAFRRWAAIDSMKERDAWVEG